MIYQPTEKEKEARKWAYDKFDIMWSNFQENYRQFNGLSLQQYLDEGRKAINIMSVPREDGRSNIKSVTPLNKLMAILARVATKRPQVEVEATTKSNIIDKKRGDVIKDLYNWSNENIDKEYTADVEYFFDAFNTQTDGICVKYEGFDSQTHKHKVITSYNPDNGDVEYEESEFKTNVCFSIPVMPEDFFVWNIYLRSVQKQPFVCWRSIIDKEHFNYEFKNFKNTKHVLEKNAVVENFEESYYRERWANRIEKDEVEVLRVYSVPEDRYLVIANGVILQDSPMPWQNGEPKKYPFASTINVPTAGGEFFYGMHLWHKLKGDVSALETLYNLGIEQAKLAVNPPYLTTAGNDLEDHMLLSGRQLEVDDINNFRELQFKSPDQSYFNFIEKIGQNIDFSSLDPVSQGQNVSNVTARGQVIAEENARKLLSQFNSMMENLVLQEAKLRIPNIIQFQLIPGAEFRVDTEIDGRSGVREVKVADKSENLQTKEELDMIEGMAELQGVNLEALSITTNWLKGIKYSIKVVSESAYQQGKSLQIALAMERISQIAQLFPNIFQGASELFFIELYRAYDEDPQKFLDAAKQSVSAVDNQLNQGQQPPGIAGEITGNKDIGLPQLSGAES